MAFRQSSHPVPHRQYPVLETHRETESALPSTELQRQFEDSQEWVVFSPAAPSTIRTLTASTGQTRTAGLSRLSDFGSLDTAAGRWVYNEETEGPSIQAPADEDEEGELDSLDSHLQDFGEPSRHRRSSFVQQEGATVLPTHDGLGTFPASSSPVQEHLYQFEQFNPRRRQRRASTLRELSEEEEAEGVKELERTRRIQEWRMEQSRVLLDEIERETRRRMSRAGDRMTQTYTAIEDDRVTMGGSRRGSYSWAGPASRGDEVVDQDESDAEDGPDSEPFWKRITRRVIRDLIGIDETILSVIFGEALVADLDVPEIESQSKADPLGPTEDNTLPRTTSDWENRVLERVARELGSLVHQISEHPGAFSTYLRAQETPDYVGSITPTRSSPLQSPAILLDEANNVDSTNLTSDGPHLAPTIPNQAASFTNHVSHWGAEDPLFSSTSTPQEHPSHQSESEQLRREREYWERELDVNMIFSFLRNRFRRGSSSRSHPAYAPLAASTTQSTAARAAMIRQQHPLTSRAQKEHPRRPATDVYRRPSSIVGAKRPSSSCASQSERGRRARGGSGSSRNYWDLGASIGSGSVMTASGGLGAWGEV